MSMYCLEQGLLLRDWEDGCVVFNPRCSDTHHLDPVAAEVVDLLRDQPLNRDDLFSCLAERLNIEGDATLSRYLDQLLLRLSDLGIVIAGHTTDSALVGRKTS